MTEQLGKITKAQIGMEDHGFLTFWLHFDFGGSGQGFGGVVLGGESGCELIADLCKMFRVDDFAKIAGRTVFALHGDDTMIHGVRLPKFDNGGAEFNLDNWRAKWFPK